MTGAEVAAAGIDLAVETPDPGTNYHLFVAGTDEGAQKLKPRSQTTARELMREVGSVLRMSEAEAANLGQLPEDPEEDQRHAHESDLGLIGCNHIERGQHERYQRNQQTGQCSDHTTKENPAHSAPPLALPLSHRQQRQSAVIEHP